MRFEREFEDGHGKTFHLVAEIAESGPALERALTRLANKARRKGLATALDGAVRVTIAERAGAGASIAEHLASGDVDAAYDAAKQWSGA